MTASIDRRRVVATTGLGIASLALRSATAAASLVPDGGGGSVSLPGGTEDAVSVSCYILRTFTATGTLTVAGGSIDVQYLLVGGGGGGGGGEADGRVGGGGEVVLSALRWRRPPPWARIRDRLRAAGRRQVGSGCSPLGAAGRAAIVSVVA